MAGSTSAQQRSSTHDPATDAALNAMICWQEPVEATDDSFEQHQLRYEQLSQFLSTDAAKSAEQYQTILTLLHKNIEQFSTPSLKSNNQTNATKLHNPNEIRGNSEKYFAPIQSAHNSFFRNEWRNVQNSIDNYSLAYALYRTAQQQNPASLLDQEQLLGSIDAIDRDISLITLIHGPLKSNWIEFLKSLNNPNMPTNAKLNMLGSLFDQNEIMSCTEGKNVRVALANKYLRSLISNNNKLKTHFYTNLILHIQKHINLDINEKIRKTLHSPPPGVHIEASDRNFFEGNDIHYFNYIYKTVIENLGLTHIEQPIQDQYATRERFIGNSYLESFHRQLHDIYKEKTPQIIDAVTNKLKGDDQLLFEIIRPVCEDIHQRLQAALRNHVDVDHRENLILSLSNTKVQPDPYSFLNKIVSTLFQDHQAYAVLPLHAFFLLTPDGENIHIPKHNLKLNLAILKQLSDEGCICPWLKAPQPMAHCYGASQPELYALYEYEQEIWSVSFSGEHHASPANLPPPWLGTAITYADETSMAKLFDLMLLPEHPSDNFLNGSTSNFLPLALDRSTDFPCYQLPIGQFHDAFWESFFQIWQQRPNRMLLASIEVNPGKRICGLWRLMACQPHRQEPPSCYLVYAINPAYNANQNQRSMELVFFEEPIRAMGSPQQKFWYPSEFESPQIRSPQGFTWDEALFSTLSDNSFKTIFLQNRQGFKGSIGYIFKQNTIWLAKKLQCNGGYRTESASELQRLFLNLCLQIKASSANGLSHEGLLTQLTSISLANAFPADEQRASINGGFTATTLDWLAKWMMLTIHQQHMADSPYQLDHTNNSLTLKPSRALLENLAKNNPNISLLLYEQDSSAIIQCKIKNPNYDLINRHRHGREIYLKSTSTQINERQRLSNADRDFPKYREALYLNVYYYGDASNPFLLPVSSQQIAQSIAAEFQRNAFQQASYGRQLLDKILVDRKGSCYKPIGHMNADHPIAIMLNLFRLNAWHNSTWRTSKIFGEMQLAEGIHAIGFWGIKNHNGKDLSSLYLADGFLSSRPWQELYPEAIRSEMPSLTNPYVHAAISQASLAEHCLINKLFQATRPGSTGLPLTLAELANQQRILSQLKNSILNGAYLYASLDLKKGETIQGWWHNQCDQVDNSVTLTPELLQLRLDHQTQTDLNFKHYHWEKSQAAHAAVSQASQPLRSVVFEILNKPSNTASFKQFGELDKLEIESWRGSLMIAEKTALAQEISKHGFFIPQTNPPTWSRYQSGRAIRLALDATRSHADRQRLIRDVSTSRNLLPREASQPFLSFTLANQSIDFYLLNDRQEHDGLLWKITRPSGRPWHPATDPLTNVQMMSITSTQDWQDLCLQLFGIHPANPLASPHAHTIHADIQHNRNQFISALLTHAMRARTPNVFTNPFLSEVNQPIRSTKTGLLIADTQRDVLRILLETWRRANPAQHPFYASISWGAISNNAALQLQGLWAITEDGLSLSQGILTKDILLKDPQRQDWPSTLQQLLMNTDAATRLQQQTMIDSFQPAFDTLIPWVQQLGGIANTYVAEHQVSQGFHWQVQLLQLTHVSRQSDGNGLSLRWVDHRLKLTNHGTDRIQHRRYDVQLAWSANGGIASPSSNATAWNLMVSQHMPMAMPTSQQTKDFESKLDVAGLYVARTNPGLVRDANHRWQRLDPNLLNDAAVIDALDVSNDHARGDVRMVRDQGAVYRVARYQGLKENIDNASLSKLIEELIERTEQFQPKPSAYLSRVYPASTDQPVDWQGIDDAVSPKPNPPPHPNTVSLNRRLTPTYFFPIKGELTLSNKLKLILETVDLYPPTAKAIPTGIILRTGSLQLREERVENTEVFRWFASLQQRSPDMATPFIITAHYLNGQLHFIQNTTPAMKEPKIDRLVEYGSRVWYRQRGMGTATASLLEQGIFMSKQNLNNLPYDEDTALDAISGRSLNPGKMELWHGYSVTVTNSGKLRYQKISANLTPSFWQQPFVEPWTEAWHTQLEKRRISTSRKLPTQITWPPVIPASLQQAAASIQLPEPIPLPAMNQAA